MIYSHAKVLLNGFSKFPHTTIKKGMPHLCHTFVWYGDQGVSRYVKQINSTPRINAKISVSLCPTEPAPFISPPYPNQLSAILGLLLNQLCWKTFSSAWNEIGQINTFSLRHDHLLSKTPPTKDTKNISKNRLQWEPFHIHAHFIFKLYH